VDDVRLLALLEQVFGEVIVLRWGDAWFVEYVPPEEEDA
jgi:hypothetical protein